MGLTRIRAQQISDIDYKQSVRVITLTDITLSGGAPAEVDGVSLVAGDRILVAGQSNAAQNGLYQVQTAGTGSNGTWTRTSDGNEDGEIQPGMVVMVTQGTVYADTPWKLVTNGEIIIGTTELTFQENYSLAFGNVFANGTAVIANTVSAAVTFTAGENISIVGNNTAKSITIGVTGITTSRIANGTSNVDIATADGNVVSTVNGNTTLTVTDTGANVAGYVTVTGNVSGGNLIASGVLSVTGNANAGNVGATTVVATNLTGTLTTEAQPNITSVGTLTSLSVTGNLSSANLDISGQITAIGNITGGNLITTGSSSIDNLVITGDITGDLLPSANVTYDLGSDTARWNDLWLANSTIYIGNGQISANNTSLLLTNPDGSSFDPGGGQTVGGNLVVLTRDSGNVNFAVIAGYLEVVGRSGNVSIPLAA